MVDQPQNPDPSRGRHAQQGATGDSAGLHHDSSEAPRETNRTAKRRPTDDQGERRPDATQAMRPVANHASRKPQHSVGQQAAGSTVHQDKQRAGKAAATPKPRPAQGGSPQKRPPSAADAPRGGHAAFPAAAIPAASPAPGGRRSHAGGTEARGKGPWRVVFWIALVILVVSLAALGAIVFSYWEGQKAYDSIAQEAFTPPVNVDGASLADLKVNWDALKAKNPDTVGWVYIPGTMVNYPIVHTTDDKKYLSTDFDGKQRWGATYGCIFLSAADAPDFSSTNNIIYGHHLNNGSMFSTIAGFEDAAKFNANRTVYVLTPQGNYKLRSFSLVHVAADDPLAQVSFASDAERTSYVQDKVNRSVVSVSDAPPPADINRIFSFATCDNLPTDGRFVLFTYIADSTVPGVVPVHAAKPAGPDQVDPATAQNIEESAKKNAA